LASHVPIITCGQNIHITITSAVGELHAGEDFNRCLARIDQGLLEGKRAGKNQVVRVC
jgi:PleD family two-component response regulator